MGWKLQLKLLRKTPINVNQFDQCSPSYRNYFCSANQLAGFYMMGNIDHNIEIVNDQYFALMQLVGSIKNATRLTTSEGKIFSKCSYEEYWSSICLLVKTGQIFSTILKTKEIYLSKNILFSKQMRVENYLRFKYWRKHMKNYRRNDSSPLNIKSWRSESKVSFLCSRK